MTCNCRYCNDELTEDNWRPNDMKRNNYACKHCLYQRYDQPQAFEKNKRNNPNRMWVHNGTEYVYIKSSHPLHKPGRWRFEDGMSFLFDPDSVIADEEIKVGYVYAITHPKYKGWVKIGKAQDMEKRHSSYQTYSPKEDYVLNHYILVQDRGAVEALAKRAAAKIATDIGRKEWFEMDVNKAVEILKDLESTA